MFLDKAVLTEKLLLLFCFVLSINAAEKNYQFSYITLYVLLETLLDFFSDLLDADVTNRISSRNSSTELDLREIAKS